MERDKVNENTRHPVEVLAEEFAQRIRLGQSPTIEEYELRYPELASVIRQVFEPIEMVERLAIQKPKDSSPLTPVMPNQLGDFRILEEIGRGGMGIVYKAIQQSLNRTVALKVIHSLSPELEQNRIRFRREAEAAAGLHHTNIVQVYGSGEDQNIQFYAMQFIDGVPLNEVIDWLGNHRVNEKAISSHRSPVAQAARVLLTKSFRNKLPNDSLSSTSDSSDIPGLLPLAIDNHRGNDLGSQSSTQEIHLNDDVTRESNPLGTTKVSDSSSSVSASNSSPLTEFFGAQCLSKDYYRNVAKLVADVANALAYAHRQKILHRDIKPANLILDHEGTIWVTDFGLARRMDLDGATRAGEVLGTLRYMAPEQIAGRCDSRMDIYSLGLCLFELLTLRPAFDAPKQRLLDPQRYSSCRSARSFNPHVPRDLDTIIQKACSVEVKSRYQTAVDFEIDLRRFLDDRPILARKASSIELLVRWARRNPAIATLATASAAMLIAIASMLAIWNRQQRESLREMGLLYEKVATNLREKSVALDDARLANQRAEANLELATQAFDNIIDNILARGVSQFEYGVDSEESIDFDEAMLSEADVKLLESLLVYFQKLGEQNDKDMRVEAASAQKRVGDIQQRIGKLEAAEDSYRKAYEQYANLAAKATSQSTLLPSSETESTGLLSQQVAILSELVAVQALQGKMAQSQESYNTARKKIELSSEFARSQQGRYQLAQLLNNVGRVFAQLSAGRPLRPERPPPGGPSASAGGPRGMGQPGKSGLFESFASPPAPKWNLEQQLNQEAIQLLRGLVNEASQKSAYRVALVQALRDEVRLAYLRRDMEQADRAFGEAIQLIEILAKENPDISRFQYELAETLLLGSPPSSYRLGAGTPQNQSKAGDPKHIERALQICDRLLVEKPLDPTYLSLKAMALVRFSQRKGVGLRTRSSLVEAMEIYQGLVSRFPDVPVHSINLINTLMMLSFAEPGRARDYIEQALKVAEGLKSTRARNAISSLIERLNARRASMEQKREEQN